MPTARAGGPALEYEVHGDAGPWVLLIHGLGYARWGWHWQIDDLAQNFCVVAFDNRGIGGSDVPPGPYTAVEMAADAVGLLDALGLERAHVIGTSLGGFVAQELAIAYPGRVDRLILACSGLNAARTFPSPPVLVDLFERVATLPAEDRMRVFVANAFSSDYAEAHPEVIEKIVGWRLETAQSLEAWQAQQAASLSFDSEGRAASIAAPTLVVTGDDDNVIDPRHSRALADAIPGARYEQFPGGHLFMIENAERFNAMARDFFLGGGR